MSKRIFKCKLCGAEVFNLSLLGPPRKVLCDAEPQMYWSARSEESVDIYTPNGEHRYASLTGDLRDAVGVGYLQHFCYLPRWTRLTN